MKGILFVAIAFFVGFAGLLQESYSCQDVSVLFSLPNNASINVSSNGSETGVYIPNFNRNKSYAMVMCELIVATKSDLVLTNMIAAPTAAIVRLSSDEKFVFGIGQSENSKGVVYTIWCSDYTEPMTIIDTCQIQMEGLASDLENLVLFPDKNYRLIIFSGLGDESFEAPVWIVDFSAKDKAFSKPSTVLAANSSVGFADYSVHESSSGIGSGKNSCFWVGPFGVPTVWKKSELSQPGELILDELGGDLLVCDSLKIMAGKGVDVHGHPKCDVSPDNQFCLVSLTHERNGQAYLVLWDLQKNKCVWFTSFPFKSIGETSWPGLGVPVCFVGNREFVYVEPGIAHVFAIRETAADIAIVEVRKINRAQTQPIYCVQTHTVDRLERCIFILESPANGTLHGCKPELLTLDIP